MKKLEINIIDKERPLTRRIQLSFGFAPSGGSETSSFYRTWKKEFALEQKLPRLAACSRLANPVRVPGAYSTAKASRTLPGMPRSPKM
jgi:hypothetical protein